MATIVFSSTITKTIQNNERIARAIWRQAVRKNVHQRRSTRGSYFKLYGRVSTACHQVLGSPESSKVFANGSFLPNECVGLPLQQIPCGVSDPSRCGLISNVQSRRCGLPGHWLNFSDAIKQTGSFQMKLGSLGSSRTIWTSTKNSDSPKIPPHTQTVVPWETVQEKKERMREVGQDIIEDLKETKAKVREQVDAIIERENIWTIPNFLCISRIAASPLLGYLVMTAEYKLALGLFMFAGFTDMLDGWIARSYPSQASRLGSFLDPLADKVLVAMLFLSLTYVGLIPVPLTVIIIYRDIVIIGGASFVRYKSLPPPRTIARYFDATHATAQLAPTTISKINTAIQLGLITASLGAPAFGFTDHYLLKGLWWLTGITTISSGISYIFSKDTYRILRHMKTKTS